jgi:hypothetical protein
MRKTIQTFERAVDPQALEPGPYGVEDRMT